MIFGDKKIKLDNLFKLNNLGILMIDIQEDFLEILSENNRRLLINSNLKILSLAKDKNIPVYLVSLKNNGDYEPNIINFLNHFDKKNVFYFEKERQDAFSNPNLVKTLIKNNTTNLIVSGLTASLCVRDTVYSALEKNYTIYTSSRLIMDTDNMYNYYWWKYSGFSREKPYSKTWMIEF